MGIMIREHRKLVIFTVNDRDSQHREFPAPGELFMPHLGRFLIFAQNLAVKYWLKSA